MVHPILIDIFPEYLEVCEMGRHLFCSRGREGVLIRARMGLGVWTHANAEIPQLRYVCT